MLYGSYSIFKQIKFFSNLPSHPLFVYLIIEEDSQYGFHEINLDTSNQIQITYNYCSDKYKWNETFTLLELF